MKNLAATKPKQRGLLKPHHALELLAADHRSALGMFADYERLRKSDDSAAKGKLALRLCHLLTLHAHLEEEIFYPAAAAVLAARGAALLGQSRVEHDALAHLMHRLEHMAASHALFDATVAVLGSYFRRHTEEEEDELFGALRRTNLDFAGLGERLASRQLELATRPPDRRTFREGRRVMAQ